MTIFGIFIPGGGLTVRLAEWRQAEGLTQSELADRLGIKQCNVSQIERSGATQVPSRAVMRRIWILTGGAVSPNDFYDLPPIDQLELAIDELAPAPLFEAAI